MSEDIIPWEEIRYPATTTGPKPVLIKYWYKARGVSRMGFPATWEGGLSAAKIGLTLGMVKSKSLVWACKQLDYIAIYDYGLHGLLNDVPILSQAFEHNDDTSLTVSRLPHRPYTPPVIEQEPDFFEESPLFTSDDEMNETFATITLKESSNDSLNRS